VTIISNILENKESDKKSDKELGDLGTVDSDLVINNILSVLIQEFNNKVVVSEGCYKADSSIDIK
jgi:hypothetical protein